MDKVQVKKWQLRKKKLIDQYYRKLPPKPYCQAYIRHENKYMDDDQRIVGATFLDIWVNWGLPRTIEDGKEIGWTIDPGHIGRYMTVRHRDGSRSDAIMYFEIGDKQIIPIAFVIGPEEIQAQHWRPMDPMEMVALVGEGIS